MRRALFWLVVAVSLTAGIASDHVAAQTATPIARVAHDWNNAAISVAASHPDSTPVPQALAPMPTGRRFLAAATSNGKIYAIGGERLTPAPDGGAQSHAVATVEAYASRTNTWTTVTPLPAARTFLAATAGLDGRIYVLGGIARSYDMVNPPPGQTTVEIYDPQSHRWSAGKSMPDGRFGLAAVTGPATTGASM